MLLALAGLPHAPGALSAQHRTQRPDGDSASEEWYLPVGNGCRLYVYETGSGRDTLVVLHGGWGAEHGYLLDAFAGLDRQYRLVFYEQRGSLRSPCPDSSISVARHVADLERLRAALGLQRATLVGHSMGTYLAMRYLQDHAATAGALVLVAAWMPSSPTNAADSAAFDQLWRTQRTFNGRPEIAAELREEGLASDTAQLSPKERTHAWRVRFAGANLYHVDRWRGMKGGQVFFNRQAAAAAARSVPQTYDFRPALASHRCPVTFISGDHDLGDMASLLRHLLAGVPNVRLDVIKDAGHNVWVDAPTEFRQLLLAALARGKDCR
jgi:pimeloyl-ACP methyl ester carboxylesterase